MEPADGFASRISGLLPEDAPAREALASRLEARLRRFVSKRLGAGLGRRFDAEDVVQASFETFLARLDRFRPGLDEDELTAHLLQIAKWTLADLARGPAGREEPLPEEPRAAEPATGVVTKGDDRAFVRERIDSLAPAYRDVLRLFYVEGRDVRSIAIEMGIDANLVKQRLARGREIIRASIARDGRKEGP